MPRRDHRVLPALPSGRTRCTAPSCRRMARNSLIGCAIDGQPAMASCTAPDRCTCPQCASVPAMPLFPSAGRVSGRCRFAQTSSHRDCGFLIAAAIAAVAARLYQYLASALTPCTPPVLVSEPPMQQRCAWLRGALAHDATLHRAQWRTIRSRGAASIGHRVGRVCASAKDEAGENADIASNGPVLHTRLGRGMGICAPTP